MLQHLGAYPIDADGLSHQAMSPGAPAYQPVVDTFGQFILNPDKTINRPMLGQIVFSNPQAMEKLEAIVHPVVRQAINTLIGRARQPVIVIEAIKLLEGDLKDAVDEVWVVDASPKSQYIRLVGKRKMSEQEAKQRILGQNKQSDKVKAADVVIKNDDNIEETWKQVQASWNRVMHKLNAEAEKTKPPQPPVSQQQAAPAKPVAPGDVTIRRGMPSNAETIARFISRSTGKAVGRMDVIMSFGQKSYLLADTESGSTVGLVGWQVENLITRVDELYIQEGMAKEPVIYAMVQAIEDASKELQSEVSFFFLPEGAGQDVVQPFLKSGYEQTSVKEIKIPAWREAVQEVVDDNTVILTKKLRQDRVLKPI
jgi:dephospho-CoA kinase